ncbi:hypothetical protein [Arenimonas sp.]|uniref:hypothetical protein n=1 Tax=Arenimonas sp. TaxID=1872635 RepID=UPI0039E3E9EB
MTKRKAIATVSIALMLGVVAALSLLHTRETDVFLDLMAPYRDSEKVFVSRPSTCYAEGPIDGVPNALLDSFLAANGPDAEPISLFRLRWHFLTAEARLLDRYPSAADRALASLPGDASTIDFSRVGFNANRTEALFCVDDRALLYAKRVDGRWGIFSVPLAYD